MKHLEDKRKLIGMKIDANWMKYKLHRDKRYLVKLNKFIEQLIVIDKILMDERRQGYNNRILSFRK